MEEIGNLTDGHGNQSDSANPVQPVRMAYRCYMSENPFSSIRIISC